MLLADSRSHVCLSSSSLPLACCGAVRWSAVLASPGSLLRMWSILAPTLPNLHFSHTPGYSNAVDSFGSSVLPCGLENKGVQQKYMK